MLTDQIKTIILYCLPKKSLTKLAKKIANSQRPWLKNWLIQKAMRQFNIQLDQAVISDPQAYKSFNAFFTRQLQPSARPIAAADLVSPADGTLSQADRINNDTLLQAKKETIKVSKLIGESMPNLQSFFTIYLAPSNYHRIHMPITGQLVKTRYIPGAFFPVNPHATNHITGLFGRNERLVCFFETQQGPFILVLIGAMLVCGIHTRWEGEIVHSNMIRERSYQQENWTFQKGQEIGYFAFGSTVIGLMSPFVEWTQRPCNSVEMGQDLGSIS